jgi:hypothetical protein
MPADREDDAVRRPAAPIAGGHGVRAGEANRAEVLDQVDALPAQMAGHVFLVMGVAGHPLAVGQHGGQVGHRGRTLETEGGPRRPVTCQAGGPRQRADRCRAAVQARAAQLPRFEQGDVRAELAGLQGNGGSGWPAADHEQADVSVHQQVQRPGPGRGRL